MTKLKIGLLVGGHVVAGLFLAVAARGRSMPDPLLVLMLAWAFADAGLLGIWGALGLSQPRWRIPILLATSATLGCVTASIAGSSINGETLSLFVVTAMATLIVLGPLTILRHSRRKMNLAPYDASSTNAEGLQFTVKHLLLITTVVAVVLGLGRAVQLVENENNAPDMLLAVVVVCPCIVIVELAILWGALGTGRPARRLLMVLPTAFLLGAIPPYYLKETIQQESLHFVGWSCLLGLQAMITAGSLLVIRSCGYILVRQAPALMVVAAGCASLRR